MAAQLARSVWEQLFVDEKRGLMHSQWTLGEKDGTVSVGGEFGFLMLPGSKGKRIMAPSNSSDFRLDEFTESF